MNKYRKIYGKYKPYKNKKMFNFILIWPLVFGLCRGRHRNVFLNLFQKSFYKFSKYNDMSRTY